MHGSHLRTVFWLRWRIICNQWRRMGPIHAIITMTVVALGAMVASLSIFIGLALGFWGLAKEDPFEIAIVWDGLVIAYLFFWCMGLVSEIQRSETVDLRRMLHLPINIKQLFYINYLVSLACFSVAFFLPLMIGFAGGLALGRDLRFLLMIPLVLSFFMVITAWSYHLRGWLISLMVNPRRRRTIIACITITMILLFQLPNLFFQIAQAREQAQRRKQRQQEVHPVQVETDKEKSSPAEERKTRHERKQAQMKKVSDVAHKVVPVLWIGKGAGSLASQAISPALFVTVGFTGLGCFGIRRAYIATLRFYLGTHTSRKRIKPVKPKSASQSRRRMWILRRIPGLADDTSGLALTFLQSYLRAPEIKMMLGSNFIMLIIFGFIFFVRGNSFSSEISRPFAISAAVTFTYFGLTQLLFNIFGMERHAFRALVLCPVSREKILFGKSLSIYPFAFVIGGILVLVTSLVMKMSPLYALCGFMQLTTAFMVLSTVGGIVSVLIPYRVAPGSLKPTKQPGIVSLCLFLTHLCFPLLMIPTFIPPLVGLLFDKMGWFPAVYINFLISTLLLVLMGVVYRASLPGMGRLLQKREQDVLRMITCEVE